MIKKIPDYILKASKLKIDSLGLIPTWSYSALKDYEKCPQRSFLKKIKGIAEPSGPAAQRGNEIHEEAEQYISGSLGELPKSLKKFEGSFKELRDLYIDAKVMVEEEWGFTQDWGICSWTHPNIWAKVKIDAFVEESENSARVIDFKTGKKWGNEIAHSQQCLLYTIAAFYRYPKLEFCQAELWYLDKKETTIRQYNRDQAMMFAPGFHNRGIKMTTATTFDPTPSIDSCRWCSYGKGENPPCTWGKYL